jgi:hypothetical protein
MSNYIPPVMPAYNPPAQDTGTVMQLSAPIYQAKGWLKFLGVLTIIGGIFQVLTIVGIISGALSIWMGSLLTQAGSSIEGAAQLGDKYSFITSMNGIKTYFTIQGVLTLISLIVAGLTICVMVVLPLLGVIPFLVDPSNFNF